MGYTKNINLQLMKKKKKKSKKKPAEGAHDSGNVKEKMITDSRFSSLHSDPRFQRVQKHNSKVGIDSRFNRMFSDKRFATSSAPLDKRGRPKKSSSENPLLHYYKLEQSQEEVKQGVEEEEEEEEEEENEEEEEEEAEEEEEESKDEPVQNLIGQSLGSESSAESEPSGLEEYPGSDLDTDTDLDQDYEAHVEDEPSVQEENVPDIEKETHRLAVVNMDWDHVKAVNLYVLLSSCLPKGGRILSVSVYPSEFGLERMEEESVRGPVVLFDDDVQNNNGDDELDEEKLRAYEKSRLRYYYAVVECDSIATADYLYKACDGVEYERSGNMLDLRFIPNSMEFKHPPRDVATEAPTSYESLDFHTRALQQSKAQLSWDLDEPHRARTLKRKFNADQLAEMELKEYLASDDSETDDDEEEEEEEGRNSLKDQSDKKNKKVDLYRALVQSNDGLGEDSEDGNGDMEVTFNTGLEDISKRVLEKKKDTREETVWEAHLRKRSEKKAWKKRSKNSSEDDSSDSEGDAIEQPDDFFVEEPAVKKGKKGAQGRSKEQQQEIDKEAEASRAELELLLADGNETDKGLKGYNIKPKMRKGKKGKEVLDEDKIPNVDYDDPRFSKLFNSHLFALDPTDPQFKRSAAYARQLAQKKQKGNGKELEEEIKSRRGQLQPESGTAEENEHSKVDASKKEKHELSSLVRSIKMKSKQIQFPPDNLSKKGKKSA